MTVHATSLKDNRAGKVVSAELCDALSITDLYDAEAEWASARVRVRQKVKAAKLELDEKQAKTFMEGK